MSDSLGDGEGNPTDTQVRLYERWAQGGVAASIIGEVQGLADAAEKPGNLVLRADSDITRFEALAKRGTAAEAKLWLQLGHAGAMAHPPISRPRGPSALNIPGLRCEALTLDEIQAIPGEFARTADLAEQLGYGGVQIHAAHGFLLSQFLSPLFNKRSDAYGGSLASRMQLLLDVVQEVRRVVSPGFVVAVKLNATDQLEGGFEELESIEVISALDETGVDLIDISGGTYFPGAKSASDAAGAGPYFVEFAEQARRRTSKPLMITGGFKTRQQAVEAIYSGAADLIGVARALVLDPELANRWRYSDGADPEFPRFVAPPVGGITAWYTMRLQLIGQDNETDKVPDLDAAVAQYEARDNRRLALWRDRFGAVV